MRLKKVMAALAAVALCVSSVGGATTAWAVENGGTDEEEIVSYAETVDEDSYTVDEANKQIVYDGYTLKFSATDDAITITGYTGKPVNVVIPATILYEGSELSVTAIGDAAFCECSKLKSIDCPNVTKLGNENGRWGAFENCTSLTKITFGTSLESIGAKAFDGCTSLTDIYYEGSAEDWAAIIGEYEIDATVTFIEDEWTYTVDEDGNVTITGCISDNASIIVPSEIDDKTVISIENGTFDDCTSLTDIYYEGSAED